MSHADAWLLIAKDIYWFVRWPLLCLLWMWSGTFNSDDNQNMVGMSTALAFTWTLIVANFQVVL